MSGEEGIGRVSQEEDGEEEGAHTHPLLPGGKQRFDLRPARAQ